MEIAAPCVVSLTWRLADAQGSEIDELSEPVEFFFGGDDLLEKVEEALVGHEAGFATTLHLEPEHAFGEYDPELVFFESREIFADGTVDAGMQFEGPPPGFFRSRNVDRPACEASKGKSVTIEASRARDGSASGLIRQLTLNDAPVVQACPQYS